MKIIKKKFMKLILAMNEQIERLIEKYFRARLKKTFA